jgi:TP901 family phage tail tape measure protein
MKKIGIEDIFKEIDIFKSVRESAESTIKTLELMNREVITTAETLKKSIGGAKFDSSKSINELNKAQAESNKLMKDAISIETLKSKANQQLTISTQEIEKLEGLHAKRLQESAKAQQQASKAETESIKTKREQARLTRELARDEAIKNKELSRSEALAKKEASAYNQLVVKTRELKNASKELASQMIALEVAGKRNSDEYSKLSSKYSQVTKQAQLADSQLKKIDSQVGDNFRNVGNYTGAVDKLKNGLGQLGLAFGIGTILQSGVKSMMEFNQQVADLQAITGAGGADLAFYAEQANKLGVNVEGGASAVVEAYKLIGSAKPELLNNAKALDAVTQSAITLSQASGMTLPESATALTDAMNQFGASADEADKFVNVLANGAKFGSAEIPQITEALLKFGSVAKSTGTSVQESTAMIELLAEKGLKGAEAGTALRNVMLKLSAPDALPKEAQKSLEGLGISLEELGNPALSITQKLEMLKPLTKDTGALMKVFGLENATASLSLLQNTDRIKELNGQMDIQGTHLEQAKQRTNTLGHALMEMKNAFTGLFTEMGTGGGAMQGLIDGLKFLGANLGSIMSIVWKVVRTWMIYKGTMKAIQAQQWIANGGFKELGATLLKNIPYTRAYRLEQIQLARSQKVVGESATASGTAMKGAGNAMKTIPFVLIISLLVELFNWWSNVASASAEARRQADLYKQAQEKGAENALKLSEATKKAYDEEIRKSELAYRKRIALATSSAEKAKIEKEMAEANIKIQEKYIQKSKDGITAQKKNIAQLKSDLSVLTEGDAKASGLVRAGLMNMSPSEIAQVTATLKKYGVALTGAFNSWNISGIENVVTNLKAGIAQGDASIIQFAQDTKAFTDISDESNVALLESAQNAQDYSVNINKTSESFNGASDSAKDFRTALSDVNDYIQDSIDLMQQLEEIYQNRAVADLTKEIDALIEKGKAQAESGNVVMGVTLAQAKTPEEQDAVDKANLDALNKANTELNAKIEERFALEAKNLEQRKKFAVDQLILDNEIAKETELNKLISEKIELLNQEGISVADKAKIEADFQAKLKQLDIENAQRDDDLRLKTLVLDEKLVDDQKKLEEDKVKTKTDSNQKILDGNKKFNKDNADEQTKANDDELKKEAEKQKTLQEIYKASADYFVKQSEKKIAQLDKEIASAEKTQTMLEDLAKNGNITAQQSLAENQKIIDEANKKKEKEQKRIQRIKLAETALTTYSQKVEGGSKTPLADTIKDIALLQTFIATIPAFEDGTEDTGKHGHGVDGKGGFHAILHPNERVVPQPLNKKIGAMSNEQLAKLATESRTGSLMKGDFQSASALDTALLANKIDLLTETIRNKPETNIELGEITQSMMEIVKTTKTGNTKIFNRYKIKP